MITLILLDTKNKTVLNQWSFDRETSIRIGRSPDNHIVIDNPIVSRHHLVLRKTNLPSASEWEIVNKGTNGTFVNNNLVSHGAIATGSQLQLGWGGPILVVNIEPKNLPNGQNTPQAQNPVIANPKSSDRFCTHCGSKNYLQNLFCNKCGQPLQVQYTIRQYQVLRILGQGGMGTTYLAWDKDRAKAQQPPIVVLKEMNAEMVKVAKARELFEREARILQSLNHPGIPKYYDFFVEGGKKYLAMEMIHGQDLEKRIIEKGPVILSQAIDWMRQTCEILAYIHSQKPPIVHRDIKPANLLLGNIDNRIVVLDFGAVKEIGTPVGTRIGAPDYSAPEQDRGQPLPQSDIYAIGPTLIFLLTGKSPSAFRGPGLGFNLENIPALTAELRKIIDRITKPKPGDRYQTAKELAAALGKCL